MSSLGVPVDLRAYDAVAFDLDGTLWVGRTLLPGALEFVRHCRSAGLRIGFATNISVATREQVEASLLELGLAQPGDLVVTSAVAVAVEAAAHGVSEVVALGGPGLLSAVADHGIAVRRLDEIEASDWMTSRPGRGLVMGGWSTATVGQVELVGRLAAAGLPLFVPSLDPGYPTQAGWEPGAGMMVAAARALHQFEPVVCGKPSAGYGEAVRDGLGGASARVLMIGDSHYSDVGVAHAMRADSVLLTNGRAISPDLPAPTFATTNLANLLTDIT